EDEAYPENLKNIASPPLFLYYRGDIKKLKNFSLAIVGTRKSSSYGRGVTDKFVGEIVNQGITTVSGLALGIDTICHRKTIALGGTTIAVVGSGLDIVYPKENRDLWELIPRYGLLISEFPLGTEPHNYNFPQRNRIIVGLSKGVLITESRIKGGSLITAEFALEEGRDVFAIPGEIFSPFSEGCNNLIKNNQAKLVTQISDVLEEYNIREEKNFNEDIDLKLTGLEQIVYDKLIGVKNLDELIMDTRLKSTEVLTLLVELEIKQLVISVPGGAYRRKK
ncbi:MAG: DNA-processing protein DprA, partial [Fusobacteriaceae bacterium]